MAKHMLLFAMFTCLACGGESVEEYNKKLDEQAARTQVKSKAEIVKTAVAGGVKIPCNDLIDAAKLTEHLGEKDPVTLSEHTREEADATALCSVRRGGKMPSAKEQAKRAKETNKLGVLPGDELCNIAAYCSIPADEDSMKQSCKNSNMQSNEVLGVFSCVKVTPKGPNDAYTYKFIDPDSRCVLQVRGGPSVNEESEVQKCAKAALFLVSKDSLPKS